MFSFKVFALTFPPICIIVSAIVFSAGPASAWGWALMILGFVSFFIVLVIALLAKIFGKKI